MSRATKSFYSFLGTFFCAGLAGYALDLTLGKVNQGHAICFFLHASSCCFC